MDISRTARLIAGVALGAVAIASDHSHTVVVSLATTVAAQSAAQAPAPDSAAVTRHLDAARVAAGKEWAETVEFMCVPNQTRANRPDDPEIAPTRLFDNVYAIGRTGTVVYALTTSQGIILIDAGYADQLDSVLLPGMKALGLDPAQVKYVLVTHGHADHFGGAAYFQERGAHVAMSAPDWGMVAAATNATVRAPTRDVVVNDGEPITLGDVTVTPVLIPGHTPGSLGFIFPAKEGRTTHTAALFGGTILLGGRASAETLDQYVASVSHFAEATKRLKVDVELQNHPLYDGFERRLAAVRARQRGQANPFVVGADGYQRFLTVMNECSAAQRERRR